MRYYIIAGEASGDLHGSNLVRGLAAEDKGARIRFWGGDMMKAAAEESGVPAELVRHYRDGAVMGFTEVLAKGFKLLRNVEFCREDIAAWKPDVVILIDYPGFNMKIASFCHRHGIKVFYYIAPKTWASREGRNRRLKAWVDRLFIVFPFEKEYFSSRGIGYVYEGNPLVDAVDSHDFVRPVPGRYIALLAGSRKAEIARTMPICMELADKLSALPRYEGYKFVVAGAPARTREDYQPYIGSRTNVELLFGRTYDILKFADAAVVNSGTASLEAALIGTPQVVCWSTSPLTYFVAKNVLRVGDHIKYISLGNLCIDRLAFRELIQDDFNLEEVLAEVRRLNEDEAYRSRMLADYASIREVLGGRGASRKVAAAMIRELKK
ncbi:MAG TPA: lipid-A-disaccharide synthase [Candidatus Cryptobacteroides excrementigallinarum]|nr:lipid-A-disaccharide synthase [Candidatus Cryptobacteroides excrementigallinarum]